MSESFDAYTRSATRTFDDVTDQRRQRGYFHARGGSAVLDHAPVLAEPVAESRKEQVTRLMRSACMITMWGVEGQATFPDPVRSHPELVPKGAGSGSIIAVEGRTVTVLTNAHVPSGALALSLQLEPSVHAEPISDVRIAYVDPTTDFAFLQFEMPEGVEPPAPIEFGDSRVLQKYDDVDVIGSTLGIDVAMPHPAKVVALPGETFPWDTQTTKRFVNSIKVGGEGTGPGSSGSGVFYNGKIVGLWFGSVSDPQSASRVGCFVPIDEIKTVLEHPKVFARTQELLAETIVERLGSEEGIGFETSFQKMVAGVQEAIEVEAVGGDVTVLTEQLIENDGTQAIRRMFKELCGFAEDKRKYDALFKESFGRELYSEEELVAYESIKALEDREGKLE